MDSYTEAFMPDQDTTRNNLAGLFAAIFTYVREKLRGDVDLDEIARVAGDVLDNLRLDEGPISWESAQPLTIGQARWASNVGRAVRVVGHVSEIHDPAVTVVQGADGSVEQMETTSARITGVDKERLYMLDLIGRPLIEKVQAAYQGGGLFEFLGVIVVLPVAIDKKRPSFTGVSGTFFLHLVDVRPTESALDLLGASGCERKSARDLLESLHADGFSPLTFLKMQCLENLGVVALDDAPHLNVAIEFACLQALSCGRIGNAPSRLHGMIVGPPAVGKKLIGLAARALNPVSTEASASKVSAAGLVGASHQTASGWSSKPGLLPMASNGVLVVQDAHGWARRSVDQIAPILQELIEDGEVRDSVAGGRKHTAEAALLVDLNRTSQANLGSGGAEAALLGVLPLLSRWDFILEVAADAERAWAVAGQMFRRMQQGKMPLDQQPWVRRCSTLVSLLRDMHPVVDVDAVVGDLEAAHREFEVELSDISRLRPNEVSAIPVRLAVTMMRYVLASARGHNRSYATQADVDLARRFVGHKLAFLRGALVTDVPLSGSPDDRQAAREAFYWRHWSGKAAKATDVAQDYSRRTSDHASAKTVLRDFKRLGAERVGGAKWRLPTTDKGTNGHDDFDVDDADNEQEDDAADGSVLAIDPDELDEIIREEADVDPDDLD